MYGVKLRATYSNRLAVKNEGWRKASWLYGCKRSRRAARKLQILDMVYLKDAQHVMTSVVWLATSTSDKPESRISLQVGSMAGQVEAREWQIDAPNSSPTISTAEGPQGNLKPSSWKMTMEVTSHGGQ